MTDKCKIKMRDKVAPVEGSVSGDTGTCPECNTPGVLLSVVGGFIRTHVIADREVPENNPQPPTLVVKEKKVGKGLSEPVTGLTDTGARVGDPRAAEQRRTVELNGMQGTGVVQVPRNRPAKNGAKNKNGTPRMTTQMVDVPATEEHVREALAYWKGRKPRTPEAHRQQAAKLADLFRWLDAMRADASSLDAQRSDPCDVHRGPTLVSGRDTTPRLRDPELSWDEPTDLRRNGEVRKSTTLDQPRGRDRFDRKITDVPEPAKKRTPAQRARFRRQQRLAQMVRDQRSAAKQN